MTSGVVAAVVVVVVCVVVAAVVLTIIVCVVVCAVVVFGAAVSVVVAGVVSTEVGAVENVSVACEDAFCPLFTEQDIMTSDIIIATPQSNIYLTDVFIYALMCICLILINTV